MVNSSRARSLRVLRRPSRFRFLWRRPPRMFRSPGSSRPRRYRRLSRRMSEGGRYGRAGSGAAISPGTVPVPEIAHESPIYSDPVSSPGGVDGRGSHHRVDNRRNFSRRPVDAVLTPVALLVPGLCRRGSCVIFIFFRTAFRRQRRLPPVQQNFRHPFTNHSMNSAHTTLERSRPPVIVVPAVALAGTAFRAMAWTAFGLQMDPHYGDVRPFD